MTIGIVGGVGPFAGLDLMHKILTQTVAQRDQDHLAVLAISDPAAIPDRTAYLLGETPRNPAQPILQQLLRLERMGAAVAGIPCNTAHAPAIMDVITAGLAASGSQLHLLHIVEEVARLLRQHDPSMDVVGLLSTIGTVRSRAYPLILEPLGFETLVPAEAQLYQRIHPAIYDPSYGLKACGYATPRASAELRTAIENLQDRGAQAVILACTELPLAFTGQQINGLPLIDSTLALARGLVRAVAPQKLRPLQSYSAG